jgi:arylsulfatase
VGVTERYADLKRPATNSSISNRAFGYENDFYAREFWRFVMVQQYVAKLAETAIKYPPMQEPATFNLDAVKQKIQAMIKDHEGQ